MKKKQKGALFMKHCVHVKTQSANNWTSGLQL